MWWLFRGGYILPLHISPSYIVFEPCLFGKYTNAKNIIYNVMTDLGEIVARDNFYTTLKNQNAALLAKGERALFYPTYNQALAKLPYQEISRPLKLTTRLSDQVYTSPLDGMFTTKTWANAIKMGDGCVCVKR